MGKRNDDIARRAWNVLRLALLWARKGGVFKRRLMMELRLVPKFIKSLGHATPRDKIHYGERELSFGETPIFHVKMHRPGCMRFHLPHIPCLNPQVDFDYDFDGDDNAAYDEYDNDGRKSFLKGGDEEDDHIETVSYEEESIDMKAEEFIANFYQQMKLQRQISYLQYNETPNRGTS
ncbi:hypothetical protein FNV43_RR23609 [Rhamnella rubrinervis]|uniref:Cotton fiber protein n=1 Tax=Rhamnella rubrinervis TaxID=2594499 RepID=A0A8K0DSC1_9ROSA|nr:hypothetical protein FNV43_RR23609 [Rhamnella rubrinervis]